MREIKRELGWGRETKKLIVILFPVSTCKWLLRIQKRHFIVFLVS